jgi:hypothetical protein
MKKVIMFTICCMFLDYIGAVNRVNNPVVPIDQMTAPRRQLYDAILELGLDPANYLSNGRIGIQPNAALIEELLDTAVDGYTPGSTNAIDPSLTAVSVQNRPLNGKKAIRTRADTRLRRAAELILERKNTQKRIEIENVNDAILAANNVIKLYNNVLNLGGNNSNIAEIYVVLNNLNDCTKHLFDLYTNVTKALTSNPRNDHRADLKAGLNDLHKQLQGLRSSISAAINNLINIILSGEQLELEKIENAVCLTRGLIAISALYNQQNDNNYAIGTDREKLKDALNADANINGIPGMKTLREQDELNRIVRLINTGIRKLFEDNNIPETYAPHPAIPAGQQANVQNYLITEY